jgi:hypothetical protein
MGLGDGHIPKMFIFMEKKKKEKEKEIKKFEIHIPEIHHETVFRCNNSR